MSFCQGFVDADSAEDVVNQAMLQAIVALRRGDKPDSLKPWLFTITRRCAIDVLRHTNRQNSLRADGIQSAGPSHLLEQRETMRSLVRVLGHLPSHERHALVARELRGSSYEEIADELGRSVGAVRQMIYRARVTVRSGVAALLPFLPRHAGGSGSSLAMTSYSIAMLGAGLSAATLVVSATPSAHSSDPAREPATSIAAVARPYTGLTSPRLEFPRTERERSDGPSHPATPDAPSSSGASSQQGDAPPTADPLTSAAGRKPGKPVHASHKPADTPAKRASHKPVKKPAKDSSEKPAKGNNADHGQDNQPHKSVGATEVPPGKRNAQPEPPAQAASKPKSPAPKMNPAEVARRSGQLAIDLVRRDLFVTRVR